MIGTKEERFWAKVAKGADNECWPWTASHNSWGYGQLRTGNPGVLEMSHRLSWQIHNGPIPDGKWVLHRCDNPPCVNPAHLFLGDHNDNMRDAHAKGRMSRGIKRHNAKLTPEGVVIIKQLIAAGVMLKTIAAEFGVDDVTITDVKLGRSWAWVK